MVVKSGEWGRCFQGSPPQPSPRAEREQTHSAARRVAPPPRRGGGWEGGDHGRDAANHPPRLRQHDRGRYRQVERARTRGHRNHYPGVGAGMDFGRGAVAFVLREGGSRNLYLAEPPAYAPKKLTASSGANTRRTSS